MLIFAEGTRFNRQKHDAQQSPYEHLLKPKAGGFASALKSIGETLHTVIDVTVAYPNGKPTFADHFSNRIPEVTDRSPRTRQLD